MKVTRLRIQPHEFNDSDFKKHINAVCKKFSPIAFIKNKRNYFAEAIEENGQYFYRVDAITISVDKYEYEAVISNPYLYYFSTALRLHNRIQREKNVS